MIDRTVWTNDLAAAIAATLQDWLADCTGEAIAPACRRHLALLALDCHPWDGYLGLAILTQAEADREPLLLDPAEMAAWEHFNFAADWASWQPAIALAAQMGRDYQAARSPGTVATDYCRASAAALNSDSDHPRKSKKPAGDNRTATLRYPKACHQLQPESSQGVRFSLERSRQSHDSEARAGKGGASHGCPEPSQRGSFSP